MSKRRRSRKRRSALATRTRSTPIRRNLAKTWAWFAGSGLLLAALGLTWAYLTGDVTVRFVHPLPSGYTFELVNDGPFDQRVRSFRVRPPLGQRVLYETTRDVWIVADQQRQPGAVGSDLTRVPAAEFSGLDGLVVPAQDRLSFRVPPLSDRDWLQPKAVLVDVVYTVSPANAGLQKLERIRRSLGQLQAEHRQSYLVLSNFWTPVQSGSLRGAIEQACRDDASVRALMACD